MNREGQFEVEVRARDSYKHYVVVRQPGETVYWTFTTRRKTIGFGLYYLYPKTSDEARLTLKSSVSSESLSLVRKNSQLLASTPSDAVLSTEHVREILRCAQPLVHITPPPKQFSVTRSASIDSDIHHLYSAAVADSAPDAFPATAPAASNEEELMIPIVPISRYSSSEATVTGSLDAPIAGTFVLLFDNTFSINTGKQLTLCVGVRRGGAIGDGSQFDVKQPNKTVTVVHGGWLLKRKRLRMQGFSKRWFKLDSTGLLTYHEDPEGSVKGGLNVRMCVTTKVPPRLLLTLDSGTELFHLKALTEADYRLWCEKIALVIQSFIAKGEERISDAEESDGEGYSEGLGSHLMLLKNRIREHKVSCSAVMEELKEAGESEHDTVIVKYLAKLEKTFATLNAYYTDLMSLERSLLAGSSSMATATAAAYHHRPQRISTIPEETAEDVFYDVIIMSDVSDDEFGEVERDRSLAEHLIAPSASTEPSIAPSFEDVDADRVKEQLAAGAQLVRLALPARATPINVSYTQLIGRMSSRNATTPVVLNEPLSLLQRQCEELEYCELLSAASRSASKIDCLALVAAFAISCYATCQYRFEYKPFTPMLGETFEWIDAVRGFRFVAEKVEHRPETILACHADSLDGRWSFWQELIVKTKTWGKTAELTPGGLTHVLIRRGEDNTASASDCLEFKWNKVTSCIRNCLSKDVFIDNFGEMLVSCSQDDGLFARVEFVKSSSDGLWGSFSTAVRTGRNEITGAIFDDSERQAKLSGRWDDYVAVGERVLWKAVPPPSNCRDYYGFSLFALQLNVPVGKAAEGVVGAPHTDSRFRPDQRLVEQGDIDAADLEKARLEQKQRAERALREERGEPWAPLWFAKAGNEYRFGRAYFENRESCFRSIQLPFLF